MTGLRPLRLPDIQRGCVTSIVFENLLRPCCQEGVECELTPVPLTGKKLFLTAKTVPWDDDPDDSDAVFKVEGTISTTEPWRVTFSLSEEDTYQSPDNDYFFDIVATDTNEQNAERLALGQFKIIGGANNAQAGGDE